MKKRAMFRLTFALLLVLALASALQATGQSLGPEAESYDLPWWSVDGWGGASSCWPTSPLTLRPSRTCAPSWCAA